MKHRSWMIRALLIGLLTLTINGCAESANFCDVVQGPLTFEAETAAQIVATDRQTGESISAQNEYWDRACP